MVAPRIGRKRAVVISVRLPGELLEAIDARALDDKSDRSEVIRTALASYLQYRTNKKR